MVLYTSRAADAMVWAYKYGNADVISNSWGLVSPYTPLTNAIDSAVTRGRGGKGCVVVFASGNEVNGFANSVDHPAKLPNVIAVGSIAATGQRADHSCYGPELDVVAPGEKVYSTDRQGRYYKFKGTSVACPHVAGVAALVLSVNPNLTGERVRKIIESTCQKVNVNSPSNPSGYIYSSNSSHPNGTWNEYIGHGLVDAFSSVRRAVCTTITYNITTLPFITTDTTVEHCGDINVQNMTVTNNAKLTFDVEGTTTINSDFEVQLDSELEIK